MPNFRASKLSELAPLAQKDGVSFSWSASGENGTKLVLCEVEGQQFFILIKPSKNGYVVKGEKISKPAQIGLLQKALLAYRDLAKAEVINEAVALSKNRIIKKDEIIIKIDDFVAEFADLRAKFNHIFIEIGFGSGRHLLHQAEQNPDTLLLGIEIYKPSIEQVAKLAKAKKLPNVRVLNTDARLVMALLGSNLIDKIFLHFPVPWPKAPHRRVSSEAFASECERVLKPGASFELRTDERDYAAYTLECFLSLNASKISMVKNQDLKVISKYEARWRRMQKDIYDLAYECETKSDEPDSFNELKFKQSINVKLLLNDFSNETVLKDGYFFHLERLYRTDFGGALIRVSLGGFYAPEHCYILVNNDGFVSYFLRAPLQTRENALAHEALEEFLNAKYNKRK